MKKSLLIFSLFVFTLFTAGSCRETKEDKAKDAVEDVGDALEDAGDDVEDAIDDATDDN